jgi:hypothetical protein
MPFIRVSCQKCGRDGDSVEYWQCTNGVCRLLLCRPCWQEYVDTIRPTNGFLDIVLNFAVWDCPRCDFKNQHRIYPLDR